MKVAIISDTHFPGRGPALSAACVARIRAADVLIHGGDLADMAALTYIRSLGPRVVAVHGNADDDEVRRALPDSASIALPGLTIGVVHNGGPEAGRLERLRRRFPDAGAVVFGHSHIPLYAVAADGFFILNPGSAADRRRQPHHTMAEVTLTAGAVPHVAFFSVDEPAGPLDPSLVRTVA